LGAKTREGKEGVGVVLMGGDKREHRCTTAVSRRESGE